MEDNKNIKCDGLPALRKIVIQNEKAISLMEQLNENIKSLKEIGIIVKYKCDVSRFEENRDLLLHV